MYEKGLPKFSHTVGTWRELPSGYNELTSGHLLSLFFAIFGKNLCPGKGGHSECLGSPLFESVCPLGTTAATQGKSLFLWLGLQASGPTHSITPE